MGKIVGIDVGFSSCGWVVMDIQGPELSDWEYVDCGAIQTKRYEDGDDCPVIVDDFRRGGKLSWRLYEIIDTHNPIALIAEVPTGSQSALGAKGLGIGVGILATFQTTYSASNEPLVFDFLLPSWVKGSITGDKRASKADVVDSFRDDLPDAVADAEAFSNKRGRKDIGDAIAALVAARLRNCSGYQMALVQDN